MTNVLTENWNGPSELAPHQLAFFYLSARVAKGDDENVKLSTTAFPASEVDAVIQSYFDVTPEHLHSNEEVQNYYDSKTDTYTFEAFGAPLAQKIVKADWGDNMLTLNYEFYSRADDITVVREGKLLVKIDADSFKYLSCSTAEQSEEITDTAARELYTQAVEEIILLATEDPISGIKSILGDDVTVIYEDINQGSNITPPPEGTVRHEFELNLVDADGNSKERAITFLFTCLRHGQSKIMKFLLMKKKFQKYILEF